MIRQITVVGTGLIGGSFAAAVRKHGFGGRIVGCDREAVLQAAVRAGVVDHAVADPVQASRGSNVVVLATPVGAIIDLIERLGPVLPPETLITDVGSTKVEVLARAKAVFGGSAADRFVAGHPMAGKEHSGVEYADPDLFQNAVWILTPVNGQNLLAGVQGEYVALLETIGAHIVTMDAERHDRVCAWISHLPQMMAIGLASTLLEEFGEKSGGEAASVQDLHGIGGRALREMTRIAASPYSWWRDVALTNTANLERALAKLEQRLAHIRESLRDPALREEFERANSFARQMRPRTKE